MTVAIVVNVAKALKETGDVEVELAQLVTLAQAEQPEQPEQLVQQD